MKTYKAPFSASLTTISAFAVVIMVAGAAALVVRDRHGAAGWLVLAALGAATLFVIRGYTVSSDAIRVQRLFWKTKLPVRHLQAVRAEPDAMSGSLRLFGNGGLFSYTGIYRNKTLGRYRAYVTDPHQTVVLRYPARTVVVSPADPEGFAKDVKEAQDALTPS